MENLRRGTERQSFAIRPKFCGNCAFHQEIKWNYGVLSSGINPFQANVSFYTLPWNVLITLFTKLKLISKTWDFNCTVRYIRWHEISAKHYSNTSQKIKVSVIEIFSKCKQIRRKLRTCSNLLKENLIFCAV